MNARPLAALAATLVLASCGDGPTAPVDEVDDPGPAPSGVAAVAVTSPIGPVLAPGATGQLGAVASDARGQTLAASFTWSSSNEATATVSATGVMTVLGPGEVTLTAETGGVSGSVTLTALEVDAEAMAALLHDPLADRLLASAGDTALGATWTRCAGAADAADLSALGACLTDAEAALSQGDEASGPLRSLLTLYAESIRRLIPALSPEV